MDETETNDRRTAALVFRRLVREAVVRSMLGVSPTRSLVCLESDSLGSMIDTLGHYHPDGATVAVYYPREQCFKFMQWIPGEFENSTSLEGHVDTTVGMAIESIVATQNNWTARVPRYSTAAIERELSLA